MASGGDGYDSNKDQGIRPCRGGGHCYVTRRLLSAPEESGKCDALEVWGAGLRPRNSRLGLDAAVRAVARAVCLLGVATLRCRSEERVS